MRLPRLCPSRRHRAAVLVDVENVRGWLGLEHRLLARAIWRHPDSLLDALTPAGSVARHAIAAIASDVGLDALEASRFTVAHCPAVGTRGKNGADIELAVRAGEILHRNDIDALVIASRDSDFAPVLRRARAKGVAVTLVAANPPKGMDELVNRVMPPGELLPAAYRSLPNPVRTELDRAVQRAHAHEQSKGRGKRAITKLPGRSGL